MLFHACAGAVSRGVTQARVIVSSLPGAVEPRGTCKRPPPIPRLKRDAAVAREARGLQRPAFVYKGVSSRVRPDALCVHTWNVEALARFNDHVANCILCAGLNLDGTGGREKKAFARLWPLPLVPHGLQPSPPAPPMPTAGYLISSGAGERRTASFCPPGKSS